LYLKELYVDNFRNLIKQKIEFSEGINILYGLNAQGKSNLLESIRILTIGKSFRNSKNNELINFGKDYFYIKALLEHEQEEKKIEIGYKKNENKILKVNGNKLKTYTELLGIVLTVIFSPEDLKIVKEGPMVRRRYIDSCISIIRKSYLYNLIQYNKILNNRNKFLKDMKNSSVDYEMIDVFDEQLSDYGSKIISMRKKYLKNLETYAKKIISDISKEDIKIEYITNINNKTDVVEEIKLIFLDLLKKDRELDLKYLTTKTGPHRDDIKFYINGKDSRMYCSQGQQRTIALCLKLSEFEIIKKETDIKPMLLLDDVMSELDINRQTYILKRLNGVQTFITHINKQDLKGDKYFKIENGVVISD